MSGGDGSRPSVTLAAFAPGDDRALREVLGRLGRDIVPEGGEAALVLAAAYDEAGLRSHRASAMDDRRPWGFCVPAGERGLVASAAAAHEGRVLLLPPDERELRRLLSLLAGDAKERAAGDAAFSGLERLDAAFRWRSRDFDVGRVSRKIAALLAEMGFYPDRGREDECALALEEAFVNSIEHGNLELDSSLRADDAAADDPYEAERARRLADPVLGSRAVSLELSVLGDEAALVLGDEGPGFDAAMLDGGPSGFEVSGKGFWLIKRPFDSASYDPDRNRLTLTKRGRGR